jgi:hypothetical protein
MQLCTVEVKIGMGPVWIWCNFLGFTIQKAPTRELTPCLGRQTEQSEKLHFVNISTVIATMMFYSFILPTPSHLTNTCALCLHPFRLLIMQSRIAAIVGLGYKVGWSVSSMTTLS